MPTLLDRLRNALRPDYEVERELAAGGMGIVFLARNTVLDHPVAVKIIRPELATAKATEQFLHEARVLAKVSHQHVVTIHDAGEADGLTYYVMEYVPTGTLAQRLEGGPLARETAVKLGRDLLDALEEVHKRGFVHRDIKPSNIFLVDRRALLADFGLTVESDTAERKYGGTPGYMPPEQQRHGTVTPRTDLYALGMVLYECLTGRRWVPVPDGQRVDWSGVARPIRRVLKRALAWNPDDRWADAVAFRRALWRTRRVAIGALITVVAAASVLAGVVATRLIGPRPPPTMDVALLPFEVHGADPQLRDELPRMAAATLTTLDLAPYNQVLNVDAAVLADTESLFERFHTDALVGGSVDHAGDSLTVQLDVRRRDGRHERSLGIVIEDIDGSAGCRLAAEITYLVAPSRAVESECSSMLRGRSSEAVAAWLAGERAFSQQQWDTAVADFERAVELDPNYGLAKWRLWNARNWLRDSQTVNLDTLYQEEADRLPEVDRMLLDAMRTTFGPVRYIKFQEALRRYPYHAYAWLLWGDDLLNRGPLLGIPTDSAASILTKAAETDSSLSPAYQQLAWALIKLGRRDQAARAVIHLNEVAGPGAAVPPQFFQLAYLLRFAPDSAAAYVNQFLGGSTWNGNAYVFLNRALRWGLSFEIPQGQLQIADQMLSMRGAPEGERAKMFTARGMALVSLGRIADALAAFDSVAALTGSEETALLDAQWPIMLASLEMGDVDSATTVDARRRLVQFTSTPRNDTVRTRAAWTLAVDAIVRNDEAGYQRWRAQLDSSRWDGSGSLADFANDWHLAAGGNTRAAFRRSAIWMGTIAQSVPDLFFRAAVHLERGKWLASLGDSRALNPWVWYQHSDVIGWLQGPPQAGEVDWAFGTLAQYRLGQEAKRRGDVADACRWLRTVADRWSDADAPLRSLADEADSWVSSECRP